MKILLKILVAPFALALSLLAALLVFLFDICAVLLTIASVILTVLGVALFFTPTPIGGIVFLFLAFNRSINSPHVLTTSSPSRYCRYISCWCLLLASHFTFHIILLTGIASGKWIGNVIPPADFVTVSNSIPCFTPLLAYLNASSLSLSRSLH